MTTMTKEGTVLDNDNGKLTLSVGRTEACGACAAKDSCGQKEETIIEVFSNGDFSKGDKVIIETNSSDVTKYSMYVYILPVAMILLGAIIPNIFFKNVDLDPNLLTLGSIVLFMILSFIIVKAIDSKMKDNKVMKVRRI